MTRIRRCYLFCAVILFALLLSPFLPAAQATETAGANASVQVKNRDYRDELFRCEAELSEANPHGQIAAFVCAETGQFKGIRFYPATSTVHVSLPNVKDTDYIKIIWLDKDCRPVAKPTIQRMERNKTVAYAQFSNALAELLNRTGGPEASDYDSGNPYALKRLIVECDESLDLNRWDASDIVRGPDGLCVLQFKSAEQAEQCAQSLRGLPSVRYAEPDRYIMADTASYSGEDTAELSDASARRYSWGADVAGIGKYVEDLMKREITGGATVAVVDSGIDPEHPLLQGRFLEGYDYVDYDNVPQDRHGHGTHIAGIIADCTAGVDVKILPVRVIDDFGGMTTLGVANGIRYAADHGADVINLSLSAPFGEGGVIEGAVRYAVSKNITVIAAAGNQNSDASRRTPARMEECVTVSAINEKRERFPRSNYGDAVDIAAPGGNVLSAVPMGTGRGYPDRNFDYKSGTSMAAAHVSAAVAALLCERGRSQTPAQISRALQETATDLGAPGWDRSYGAGMLNMAPFIRLSGAWAVLYADGELVFQNSSEPVAGRTPFAIYPIPTASAGGAEYAAWYGERNRITKATFAEKIRPASTALWFCGCTNLFAFEGMENLDTSGVTNMSQMFAQCESLTELDLTVFDTANVTDMSQMFYGCTALKTILVSERFVVDAVEESADMFTDCAVLRGGHGTPYMSDCTDKRYARFDGYISVSPGYFTKLSDNIYAALYDDGELVFRNNDRKEPGRTVLEAYETGGRGYWYSNLPPWHGRKNDILTVTFADKVQPESTAYWFYELDKMTSIRNLRLLDTSETTDMCSMFYGCSALKSLDVGGFDTGNVRDMAHMFSWCSALISLDVSGFDTENVGDMRSMFWECSSLTAMDASNFDTSHVRWMASMFEGCRNLVMLDITGFVGGQADDIYQMFWDCPALVTIYASPSFNWGPTWYDEPIVFENCVSLVGGQGTRSDGGWESLRYARIDGGPDAPGFFTEKPVDETVNMSAEELFHLGEDYFDGKNGKPQNRQKSIYYYEKSAEKGSSYAMNDLGYIYQHGYGTPVDYEKALRYYQQSAEMGNPHALNNLGYVYENGLGVKQDFQKAMDYYKQAIDAGSENASTNLLNLQIRMMFSGLT